MESSPIKLSSSDLVYARQTIWYGDGLGLLLGLSVLDGQRKGCPSGNYHHFAFLSSEQHQKVTSYAALQSGDSFDDAVLAKMMSFAFSDHYRGDA